MAALGTVLGLLTLAARAHPASIILNQNKISDSATLNLEPLLTGGFEVVLLEGNERNVVGQIGRTLMTTYTMEEVDGGVEVQMGGANLTIQTVYDDRGSAKARGIKVRWTSGTGLRLEDCYDFGEWNWYGGRMTVDQIYPIQSTVEPYSPYYSKEYDNGAIVERYWLNSNGQYIYVYPEAPLFVDYNSVRANHLCLGAQIADPYSWRREQITFEYNIWWLNNVKEAHKHAVENYLGKPSGVPDFRMVQHPIWSTWAQYSKDINEDNLLEFANEIREHGFNNSQFEIDDFWETCYGSLTVDQQKFSDFGRTVQDLKALGYRVTLWVHPFINKDCEPFYSEALQNGYLVLNEEGSPDASWWNGNGSPAGYIDFTKPVASEWFASRVRNLTIKYGIDSFKFDAGESSFTPQIAVQAGNIEHQPHSIVESYVRAVAQFGDMIEVRAAFMTQDLPIFVRMVDRDSIWGMNNGLPTIITTTIQMNLAGYTLVLPDMIGGNGYNLDHDQADLPTKELFIRWVQANTFLPAMQYSFAPWNFDNETLEISKKYTELHAAHAEEIYGAMQASVAEGTPVNAPLWWLDPTDENCLVIWDEYLLGENIIVAPVLVEGATVRDIYLPVGTWWEEGDPDRTHVGPTWLLNHPAPLDYLPYFVRERQEAPDAAVTPGVAAILVLWGIIANIVNALFILAALGACTHATEISILDASNVKVRLQDNPHGGLNIMLDRRGLSEVISVIGRGTSAIKDVVQDGDVVIQFTNDTAVRINVEELAGARSGLVITLAWEAPKTQRLEDCINLGSAHWYGGPQQKRQYWPIEKLVLPNYSYITKEADNCGIAEPYWLSSNGIFYYLDKKVPLFVDQNDLEKNAACFIAEVKSPYSNKRTKNDLIYAIGIFDDVRKAHEYAVERYLEKPTGYPDERMITHPIWSTWARYKTDVNHDVVLEFADEVMRYGFNNSQLEIDDLWETCYGSQTVDEKRFPDMKNTVNKLKEKGFRVTIWTHPFLNKGCEPWYSEAKEKGYLVESESGSVETSWWNDNGTTTAYIDFTKPAGRKWYTDRVQKLKDDYEIDSFKFDGGESSWSPQIPVLQGDIRDQPGIIAADYIRLVATFGPMAEVRAAYRTQDLPIFVRMIDKDTYWTFENGLPTLITTLLQMNMNGYPLVLPDMIGGNGYNDPPSKELFIRWLQANVFMPSMQFSYVPWDFDNETIAISKKFVELHAQYAPHIIAACQQAVAAGSPVNPPVWWIAPNDTTTHDIWDEFLLGDKILVAPVVERAARSRDVYLPAGTWLEQGDTHRRVKGGEWIRNYPAPLDELPFFVKL